MAAAVYTLADLAGACNTQEWIMDLLRPQQEVGFSPQMAAPSLPARRPVQQVWTASTCGVRVVPLTLAASAFSPLSFLMSSFPPCCECDSEDSVTHTYRP